MARTRGDILIVDDDAHIVRMVVDVLSEAGYSICVAYDGASALLAMELAPPALILLDLHMPGTSGHEVLARQWWNGLSDIPIVIMTADAEAAQTLTAYGFFDYILKPFTVETLLTYVTRYICSDPD